MSKCVALRRRTLSILRAIKTLTPATQSEACFRLAVQLARRRFRKLGKRTTERWRLCKGHLLGF